MIDVLFEQRVIQNTGLGAEAIWTAANEAFETTNRVQGVSFPLVFLVLPLVYHKRTAEALASKARPGAIYKALAEDREIAVGLQQRMQALSDRTFQALSIGFSTGLLRLDENADRHILPDRKTAPISHVTEDVKIILNAAKRVGQMFAELTVIQISSTLGVRF